MSDTPAKPARRRSPLVIALSLACGILLLASAGLSFVSLQAIQDRDAKAEALSAAKSELASLEHGVTQQIGSIEVNAISDLEFGKIVILEDEGTWFRTLHALMTNTDPERAVEVYFDITAYDADGLIIERSPSSSYVLPGQQSVFTGIMTTESMTASTIKIEQTRYELVEPYVHGDITMGEARGSEAGFVEADFTSTLDAPAEYADVFLVGFVGDEIVAACNRSVDIPANAPFTSSCLLNLSVGAQQQGESVIPPDAKFDGFLALEIPF